MVFSSYVFLFLFLPILFVLYYVCPARFRNARNIILLAFSLVFYSWNIPRYLLILLVSILVNWIVGLLIGYRSERNFLSKVILAGGVAANCLLLGYYKYADFVIENVNSIFGTEHAMLNIALPIGISFFTFQGLSYVIDVYRGQGECQKNPLNVALYISLFPQLVAGPIVRYDTVAKQIMERKESLDKCMQGLQRFVLGLAKKIIIADTFGIIANQAFDSTNISSGLAWVGAVAYTMQIYFDFSGYSDMAIGLGKLFGFDFNENFNYPYVSKSVTEFWRRWHMSLSSWFRDYIYIPLGGNRVKRVSRHVFNMFVVWGLTGLWHGASWNFIVWGLYYFAWLVIEKYLLKGIVEKVPTILRWLVTFLIVMFGWILFRAENLTAALDYMQVMFTNPFSAVSIDEFIRYVSNYMFFWVVGIIAATPFIKWLYRKLYQKYAGHIWVSVVKYIIVFGLFLICCMYVIASSYNAFIYFQF